MGWRDRLKILGRQEPAQERGGSGSLEVGWLLDTDKAGFIWFPPSKADRDDPPPTHAKSVGFCPAMLDHEQRLFQILCPFDAHLGINMGSGDQVTLTNKAGDRSTIRSNHLNQMLGIVSRKEWRHPDRPIIQITTPYLFISDQDIYITQMPPIGHYNPEPWPGVLIGGRFPIRVWPRHLMWAFEWWDPKKDLILRRGQPWFSFRFESKEPSRKVRLVEAQLTPELREYMNGAKGVTNYVSRTFSLFKVAEERRPEKLLVKANRASPGEV